MSSYGITLENGIGLFFKLKINNFQVNKHQPRIHVATIGSFSSNLKYVLEIETETGNLIGELKCRGLLLQRNKIFYRKWKEEEWRSITLQMNLVVDENKEHYINCELSMNGKSKAFVYNSNEIGIDTMLKLTFDVAIGFLEFPDKPCISYDIANMFCFKGVLDEKNFLFLNSISSNVRNLMRSSSEVPYAFYNYYTIYNHDYFKNKPKFLKVIAEIMEAPEVCIRSLQKKTIFILDSSDPAHYCLSTLPVDQAPKDLNYLLTLIDLKREQISWHGPSRVINNYSFMHDLACLAPTKTLIYLYARSVELNFSGEAQSIALDILCTSVRNGIVSLAEYTTYGGIFIPLRIMTSKSAQIGSRDILAIASMAITQLYLSKEGNICASSGSVVADASVLVILFNSLNMWNVKKLETLSIFVQIIIDCITVGKCRNFQINRKQINCKNLIKTILDTFIAVSNESSAECEKFVECSLVLFKELSVMSSGSFAALYSLFRFVFLTHPANAVCFHYDPKSSESWIKFGDLYERSQLNLPMTKTTLSEYFTDLMKRNEKSQILKYYKDNNSSATAVRKKYIINDKARVLPEPRKFDSPSPVSDDFEESIKQQTIFNWMSALRGAILEFLSSTLVICSDSLMVQLQDALIWPAILVLLTEQTDVTIQTNTFKLLERFLNRAPDDVKIEFIQKGGFNVIACQLKHCHISLDIINSLFSMVCLETVNVAQGLDDTHIQSIPPNAITFSSFVAAHALLERSSEVGHPFDFWKVCCALMKIFEAQPMLRQVMMECNLMDSMFTALRNILNRNYILNHSAAMEAFTSFLHKIFNLSIPFDNVIFYEKCNSFVYKCMILEYIQPPSSFSNRKFRDIISSCLKWWLESIRDVFNDKYMVVSASRSGSPIDFEYDLEDEFDTESGTFENIPIPIPQFTFSVFQNNVQNKKNKKCVYKWKNQTIPESLDILSQRLNQALKFTSQYFLFHGHKNNDFIAAEELDAFSLHIKFLFHVWNKSSESCNNKKIGLDDWNKLLLMCKPKAGYYLLQLISCTLCSVEQKIELGTDYPLSPPIVSRQLRLLQMLINVMDTHKTSLMKLLDFDLDSQYFLNIGLHELALNPLPIEHEIPEFDESIDKLLQLLIAVKITTPFDDLSIDSKKHLISEETLGLKNYVDLKKQYISELRTKATTYQDIVEKYNSEQTEIAWACTRDVNSYQVFVRKIFGKSQIGVQKSLYEAEQFMFKLSQTLTHPAGPLANMESWPKGWCLDRTESDCRERRRLSPFNYNYGEKYVMDDQKESMGNAEPLPLSKLLNESTGGKDISIEYVKTVDSIKQSVTVSVIMPNLECNGELLLATECIYFFGETAKTSQKELECEPFTLSFECSKIREIYKRQYLLNDTALEVFFTDGETLLLAFQTISDRENAIGLIASLDLPNLIINLEGQLKNITQIWRKGIMTTFEYLMLLNKLAGRSYNDLMQYPVFPFIIADYVSDHLNLNVLSSFRNLQKPIAIQDKTKEDYYVKYFNDLQDEYDKFKASQNSKSANTNEKVSIFSTWPPYHYGSHYSNSGIITHYLVRLSPFTSVALEYQDDHFDIADRLFNSLETTWSLASSKSTTDFKELIPEFFYFPEFLENKNKLDLGVRQDSKRVCDVQLPPWVPNNNARLFTLINRQALESNIVSLHLHNWIDLTFGYKQNGDPAVKAVNVFHPLTYRGKCYEAMSENDQVIETALKTIVRTYGQMAAQLFQTAHLPRLNQTMQLNQIPIPSPLPTISGIKWGDYVGSPNAVIMEGSPFRLNISANGTEHFKLYDSSSNSASCVAVREGIILLKQQITNKKVYYIKETDQEVVAAVSWKNKSNILKVKFTHSENSWQNIWHMGYQTPTCINYSSCNNRLFVGFESGSIFVLQLNFTEKRCLVLCDFTNLLGHTASITSLSVSDMYSVIVSTSKDSKVCLWDSNKLTFIRNIELPPHSGVVELSDISSSSGDIVIIVNGKKLSQVMLFTINASLIGNIDSAIRISSISMTNLPEGISVNSLIVGLANGRVQLIEMWTMSIIREFQDEISLGKSVVNLLTTNSAKRLFVVYNDGTILCWQSAASNIRLPTVETMYIDVEQEVNLSFTDG